MSKGFVNASKKLQIHKSYWLETASRKTGPTGKRNATADDDCGNCDNDDDKDVRIKIYRKMRIEIYRKMRIEIYLKMRFEIYLKMRTY